MGQFKFDFNTTRFDLLNAQRCAEAAQLVYQSKTAIMKKVKSGWGFSECAYFDAADTQAFVATRKEGVLVSFRGTESLTDWQTNAKVKKAKVKCGHVHRGFKRGLDYVWGQVRESLFDPRADKRRVWVAGHSLGGALATLCVDRLVDLGYDVGGLYTFGQPRVGDKTFARGFDNKIKHRTWRFVNNEDIVPRVPPRTLGYKHIGTVRYFNNKGYLIKNNVFWMRLLDRSISVAVRSMDRYSELRHEHPNGIQDHSMAHYVKFVKKNRTNQKSPVIRTFKEYINS